MEQRVPDILRSDDRLSAIVKSGEDGAILGMAAAITMQMIRHARGLPIFDIDAAFVARSGADGLVEVRYGSANMNKVQPGHEATIREVLLDYESKLMTLEHFSPTERLYDELTRLQGALRDELSIVTLRRIVPGKCKYCPV